MQASRLDCPGLPLDAPSKLSLKKLGIGGCHLTVDLSVGVCSFEEVLDPNGMKIDFHSRMILLSQEVIIGLDLHLLTLALVTSKIYFSIICSTLSKDESSFLKILLFLSHQIAQKNNAGAHLQISTNKALG